MKIINDCLDLIHQKPGLIGYLRGEDLNSKWKILNDFIEKQDKEKWKKYKQIIFFETQQQFGLDMGFCPHYDMQLKEGKIFDYCMREDITGKCFGAQELCPSGILKETEKRKNSPTPKY